MNALRKYVFLGIVVFIVSLLITTISFASGDTILAVVNREAITEKDLKDYLKSVYMQLRVENKSEQEINDVMGEYEKKGIQQIIEDKLVLFASEQSGLVLRTELVDQRVKEIQSKYPTQKDFEQALIKEGLTVSDIRKKIENQIKGQIIINREVRSKIMIKPQEVTEWFEKNKESLREESKLNVASIFVTTKFDAHQARKKIESAYQEIKQGIDFKAVAAKYSELPSIGVVALKKLKPEMVEVLSALRVGDVSKIIEMSNGFYIFKLDGRREAKEPQLNDVRREIQQRIFEEKFRVKFQEWIEHLRQKAYVEIKTK